jgi:Uma2 family endonuclease
MFQRKPKLYTPQEYLALEDEADSRSEYYDGEIFAMAGSTHNHDMIVGDLYVALHQFGKSSGCIVYTSSMKLLVKKSGLYTYPDVMVVCGRPKFAPKRNDTITNPVVIVEVLSKSTQQYDRGKKFEMYQAIETLQAYILIAQNQVYLEVHSKQATGGWREEILTSPNATLTIAAIGCAVPISEIYERVDWDDGTLHLVR